MGQVLVVYLPVRSVGMTGVNSCSCNAHATIRPAIGNLNWGGVGGVVCGAPNQALTFEFFR